ncbi:hypothetical protein CFP65_3973 [Kitasatospora sp. MMS16-BH015]|uniref:hypothetical protein n=1 Tax=Kitasatospora sp. MMS16-BH015 TaxID=2018025 RepID=UPI000CA30F6B|nr:hypothetical protein [Kitasatospora sp. MMS16-BH015]AUG78743.1 hypothetical protein CFP65_3973 [Kitasatospora sp. MMS16-BH015]
MTDQHPAQHPDQHPAQHPDQHPAQQAAEHPVRDIEEIEESESGTGEAPAADLLAAEPRRARPGLLRWGAAALVLLLTGAGAAFAVTAPERTDLPGLRTPNDGRYAFAPLSLPPLPPGRPAFTSAGSAGHHYADLRQLLLPMPKGATPVVLPGRGAGNPAPTGASPSAGATASPKPTATPSAPTTPAGSPTGARPADGLVGKVGCTDYAARDLHPAQVTALLTEAACRSAAERVWTGPDGTRAELWLLRFGSGDEAGAFYLKAASDDPIELPGLKDVDNGFVQLNAMTASALRATAKTAGPGQDPVGRVAYLRVGDVYALVALTNPKGVPAQAFRQVTMDQDDLLQ